NLPPPRKVPNHLSPGGRDLSRGPSLRGEDLVPAPCKSTLGAKTVEKQGPDFHLFSGHNITASTRKLQTSAHVHNFRPKTPARRGIWTEDPRDDTPDTKARERRAPATFWSEAERGSYGASVGGDASTCRVLAAAHGAIRGQTG